MTLLEELGDIKMSNRVQLQRSIETRLSDGSVNREWIQMETVWARIEPITGREYWNAEQVKSELTHMVVIRYMTNVTSRCRLLFNNRILNILGVVNVEEQDVFLQLRCKELAGGGGDERVTIPRDGVAQA